MLYNVLKSNGSFLFHFISTDHEALKEAVLQHAMIQTTSSLVPSLHFFVITTRIHLQTA